VFCFPLCSHFIHSQSKKDFKKLSVLFEHVDDFPWFFLLVDVRRLDDPSTTYTLHGKKKTNQAQSAPKTTFHLCYFSVRPPLRCVKNLFVSPVSFSLDFFSLSFP